MSVIFEIIDGPQKGRKVTADRNHFIGRQGAEVEINDPKMSSRHAQVIVKPDGTWELRDNKSTNGIKVEGKKVKSLVLKKGARVRIGQSVLKVIEISDDEVELSEPSIKAEPAPKKESKPEPVKEATSPTLLNPEPTRAPIPKKESSSAPKPTPPSEPEFVVEQNSQKTWDQSLEKFAQGLMSKVKNNPRELTAFTPQLKLKFLRGPQVETSWTIGYGPRAVGPSSPDLPIEHSDVPDICFELQPHKGGCRFVTEHTKVVKINNQSKSEHLLRDGDEISIHNILIRVQFSN